MSESRTGENDASKRTRLLRSALTWVRADASVDVVGRRFAGRTHFLRTLAAELENDARRVLWVSGNSFVQSSGLAALDFAGLMEGPTRGRSTLRFAFDSVLARADARGFVVIVDDWDGLDEASWGVLVAAQQRAGFPIVRGTLRRGGGVPPSGTPAMPRGSKAYLVDLQPMRFDELDGVLAAYLGGPLDSPTLARVLAKSGGVVGLAISIVDSARAESILQWAEGVWTARGSLWTPALTSIVETYLSDVTDAEWDALQLLAMVGEVDPASAAEVLGWEPLEALEDRALVEIHSIGSRRLIAVVPPLVTEFLRRGAPQTRRTRLTGILTRFAGVAAADEPAHGEPAWQHPDGLFVRAIGERTRVKRHEARMAWLNEQSCATALRYLRALDDDHGDVDEILGILGRTDLGGDDGDARAQLSVFHAWWIATVDGDVDGALALLERSRDGLGVYEKLIDAARVDLLVNYRDAPVCIEDLLRTDGDLPSAVRDKLTESLLAAYISRGRFDRARAVLADLPPDAEGAYPPGFLAGLVSLFDGDPGGALRMAYTSIEAAHDALDARRLRWFAYLAALAQLLAGRDPEARSLVDLALSLGRPPWMPPTAHLALLGVGGLLAHRRGDDEAAAVMLSQRRQIGIDGGMLPFDEWPAAQRTVNLGDDAGASALLWRSGARQWERGARLRGLVDLIGAVELAPGRERLKEVRRRADELDSRLFRALVQSLVAAEAHDQTALLDAVPELIASGLPGRAYAVLTTVQKLRTGNPGELAADLRAVAADLDLSSAFSDVFGFGHSAPRLSRRELEIAQLAAAGVSNQGIAERFTISTRTVENHIHRILRKTGLDRRDALRAYMLAGNLR